MKILVIGSGGREHAIVWKLAQSPLVEKIYCAPGNGGIAQIAECVAISQNDFPALIQFVKREGIELTVVGPEDPLLNGIVDQFEEAGLEIYGPNREAALIEGSKSFAKQLMKRYQIPTASYEEFTDYDSAWSYVQAQGMPIVIKADGLAAGKGVVVAHRLEEARLALEMMLNEGTFGKAGARVVIEQFLQGEEVTLLSFVDGVTVIPMEPAQDHKAVYDGDKGPNTGGMGCYSPVPQISQKTIDRAVKEIVQPITRAMAQEGYEFRGILYTGLMITADGPKVIEFNARFGDPETQVILPRLQNDLVEIILRSLAGKLSEVKLEWSKKSAVTVIMASTGYPNSYPINLPIEGVDALMSKTDTWLFHAGTSQAPDGTYRTQGGRVVAITSIGDTIEEAKQKAYEGVAQISFTGAHYRRDIGDRALGTTSTIEK